MAIVAAAGALRFGEIVALRTTDVDVYFDRSGFVDCVRIRICPGGPNVT
ncbi:putative phage integrase (C-terminal fragment) [Corynebacterium glutamicum ATCC 13032]|nr:putative phage integrase (C-terminal fragment) [Corynebacterium glutamicum ATCC 13032]